MTRDYSNQENVTYGSIPVKGASASNFSIRVDMIRFLDDDTKKEVDIRVWSNTGRPSGKGIRMTLEQAKEIQSALQGLLADVEVKE